MKKRKLLILTPAYDKKVHAHYAMSLLGTKTLLESNGIEVEINFRVGDSLLVVARNCLIEQFYQSDATHALCIDSDIGWPPFAVLSMINSGKDFVAGVYPARHDENTFYYSPSKDENGNKIMEGHLMKVDYIPAGFMMISKEVIEKMRNFYPELEHENPKSKNGFCFFNTEFLDRHHYGEDAIFCKRAREAGIDIWVDTLIPFKHDEKQNSIGRLPDGSNPYII
jgi:hypothetical protein